jgi:redox-sensitive bicupin YhaK (pirin superfamily)
VHVLAGDALGAKAVIGTRTPIGYLHCILSPGAAVDVSVPPDHAACVYVFEGAVRVGGRELRDGQLAVLGDGDAVHLTASARRSRSC